MGGGRLGVQVGLLEKVASHCGILFPSREGPRICPAQQQVLTYSLYLLVKLTQKFESLENCDPVEQ
jgi:hypothetical protein